MTPRRATAAAPPRRKRPSVDVSMLTPAEIAAHRAALAPVDRATFDALVAPVRAVGPLADFIPRISPKFAAPRHLHALTTKLEEAARGKPLRLVVDTPPRHGKTETLLHFIAWTLRRDPERTIGYVGYAAEFARSKSRRARMLALDAGVELADDAARLEEWRTTKGGGLLATGVGGPLTGHGVNVLLVDDPIKNRVEAESATYRDRAWEWFNDVAFTRLEPGGAAIVVHTRWHVDDLAGRLLQQGWESLHLPAIDDAGRALWPERFTTAKLDEIREQVGEYTWASLYQGQPRPRGGSVFGDAHTYDALPRDGLRWAIGVDLAYAAKTHSDYSVAVLLAASGSGREQVAYVVDVVRLQVRAPEFGTRLATLQDRAPTARVRWYASGTEAGVADYIQRNTGVRIEVKNAGADKFVRAQPVAAGWNAGKVLVPADAPWADDFLVEMLSFTGLRDPHDDQVDALAAAYDTLVEGGAQSYDLSGVALHDDELVVAESPWTV